MSNSAVRYRTVKIGEVEMFYREAGDVAAPLVLLLHGFPTSSHMYRDLIPQLADRYRLIAPDLPGFGWTKAPPRSEYRYTFGNLYKALQAFVDALGLDRFAMMVFDYGAPVGFRFAAAHSSRIAAIITQNGNAYEEGLREDTLVPMRANWERPGAETRNALRAFLTPETTRFQFTHGVPPEKLELVSPDAIEHAQAILDRDPDIQLDLFATTRPTSPSTRAGRSTYGRKSRPCWPCGVTATRSSAPKAPTLSGRTFPTRRSTYSTPATSPWRPTGLRSLR